MGIKLIAVDLDGTLLNSRKNVLKSTIDALKYALRNGCIIALATGRLCEGSKPYLSKVTNDYKNTFGILANGSFIQSFENGEILYKKCMPLNTYTYLFHCANQFEVYMNAYTPEQIYTPHKVIDSITIREAEMINMPVKYHSIEKGSIKEIVKAQFLGEMKNINRAYKESMKRRNDGLKYMHTADYAIEISNKGVSKGDGLLKLAAKLGIAQNETMAIGDHNNDIELIKLAGVGVCMGNGSENAKKVANFITDSNDNDGISKAIYKFI